jgi:hypothetical protein
VNDRLRLQWTVTVVIMAFSLYSPNSDGLQLIVSVSTILRRCLGLLPRGERVKKTWSIWGKNTGRKGGCGVLCNLESSSNGWRRRNFDEEIRQSGTAISRVSKGIKRR